MGVSENTIPGQWQFWSHLLSIIFWTLVSSIATPAKLSNKDYNGCLYIIGAPVEFVYLIFSFHCVVFFLNTPDLLINERTAFRISGQYNIYILFMYTCVFIVMRNTYKHVHVYNKTFVTSHHKITRTYVNLNIFDDE